MKMNYDNYAKLLLGPDLLKEIEVELASRRLYDFVKMAWAVLEPGTIFVPGWHIGAICEHLEAITSGQIRNLLITVPPRHMKSLAVSVFWPAWEWIRHPERRWMFASYAETLSIRDSVQCRRLIQSPWYQSHWSDRFVLTTDQNEKRRFDNDRGGHRLASSVNGSNTGEGGDRIVIDDPHNVKEAESVLQRQEVIKWHGQVMSTRLNDPKTGARVMVMQRVHERDLAGHVLEQGGYEHLCLPAEYEGNKRSTVIGWSDPREQNGELLWPERFGPEEIRELKRSLGSYGAAGQLQQRPSPAEGGCIQRHWWRYWQPIGPALPPVAVRHPDGTTRQILPVTLPEPFDEMFQSWDCAFKELKSSDYVVGQVWGRRGADKYLVDQVRKQMDCPRTIQAIRALSATWPRAHRKLIEDKANGSAVIQMLRHEIGGLIAVEPAGGKIVRANAASPQIESGNVYLPHPMRASWVEDFIEECAAFPQGRYDDQVDAMSQALLRRRPEPRIRLL
jgi:predicted phage terminase large subunit-like protein